MDLIKEEFIPKRIRQMRLERNMTQQELADAIGVTKGYISRIENGNSAPPVGRLIELAQVLGIEMNAFFQAEDPEVYVSVTRSDERPTIARDGLIAAEYEHLAMGFPNRAFEGYIMKVDCSSDLSELNQHKGQELIFVLRGQIELVVNENNYVLGTGDAIQFNSSYPHQGACISEEGAELFCIIYSEGKEKED